MAGETQTLKLEVTMSADDLNTKPTIETVLERINALAEKMDAQSTDIKKDIAEFKARFEEELGKVNERLDAHEVRFDRLEKITLQTRLEFVELREDFREWRKQLKHVLPPVA